MKTTTDESIDNLSADEVIKDETNGIDDKKSQCNICGQKFRFLKALQKHELRHQGTGGFVCRTCNQAFTSAEAREKHRDKEHKVLRCKICNIRFETDTEYLHHINSLHEGRDKELSMCSECGKQFKTKGELTHHVSSKCGTIKKYKCSVCFQTLMTAGSLHNHMLRHTGQRTFMCRFCAKTFLTAGQLTVHERIHTQEKAFVCEICNKGFCHRQSLITHSTLHTGIKPYQCEGCGNAFSCVGNLLKHRKTHADSCGKIPLTTHRVKHPATRIKVQVNTPQASKLRTIEKQKRIEQAATTTTHKQQPTTVAWQRHNTNSSSHSGGYCNPGQQQVTNHYDTYNTAPVALNMDDGNTTEDKLEKSVKSLANFESSLALESSECVKQQERWVPGTNTNFQMNLNETSILNDLVCQTDVNFSMCDKIQNDYNSIQNGDILDAMTNEVKEFSELNDDWDRDNDTNSDNDSQLSDDSVDLHTRLLRNNGQTETNQKNGRSRHKTQSTTSPAKLHIDRDELEQFIHDREFDEESGMNCKYCGSHYSIPLWLLKHERKHEQGLKHGRKDKVAIRCSCCNITFETKQQCVYHQQCSHAEQLTCKECDRMFANPDSMKAHTNFYHRGVPRKKYIYVCEKCGKVFKQKALLVSHEQSNCGQGPLFQCDICDKSFTSKHVQKSHMRIHLPEKSLLCKFCGKSFHWKGQLKIHERSHTGERPFKCQFCPKAFSYRESLITHSTMHTGIKPHLCEACGSRFSCIGNLLKHRRTHANTCGLMNRMKTEIMITS